MNRKLSFFLSSLLVVTVVSCTHQAGRHHGQSGLAGAILSSPARAELNQFKPVPAPAPKTLLLKKGDRLAICGDSITEQKMYSRIMETYLTVCTPDLEIATRQFGWSGEKADGFLARMTNDVLRFEPNVATTCYGMNDHQYRPYEEAIGERYRRYMTAIVESFKAHKVDVVLGSPGCVGKKPSWSKDTNATSLALNKNLLELRNIGLEVARSETVRFADVFWPMLKGGYEAQATYGTNFNIAGKDGVHPDWSGQLVMAYAFLKAFGLDGDLGSITFDLKSNSAQATGGHSVVSANHGAVELRSSRYPFCISNTNLTTDNSIRAGMSLVPFTEDLNRFHFRIKNGSGSRYKVTWGKESKTFSAAQLKAGINLAEEFPINPFAEAFSKVDKAVAAKQAYETKQIKQVFRSAEAKADMEGTAAKTERERAVLVAAIKDAFVPVTHTISVESEQ